MRLTLALLASVIITLPCSATIAGTSQWNVMSTGNALNGGFFVPGASGTNRSLQATAQWAASDAVTNGTITITSATANFDATIVGNGCYVAGGTGTITGAWYEVITFTSSTSIDVDRGTGLTTGTGATINCGGAMDSVPSAYLGISTFNTIWVKAGTYIQTVAFTVAADQGLSIIGYNTTQGDITLASQLTRPLVTTATNSTVLWAIASFGTDDVLTVKNIRFSNTAGTRDVGFRSTGARGIVRIENCQFDGFSIALSGPNGSGSWNWNWLELESTEVKNSVSDGIYSNPDSAGVGDNFVCRWSWIHDNGGHGVNWGRGGADMLGCILTGNTGSGYFANADLDYFVSNGTSFSSNTVSGLDLSNWDPTVYNVGFRQGLQLFNNVFWDNGTYGVNLDSMFNTHFLNINYYNAYGSNGTAARNNLPVGTADVTLTVDPFTNAASGDYSLNSTAGGGASLRSAGYAGLIPPGSSTGYLSIGPVQPNAAGTSTSTVGFPTGN